MQCTICRQCLPGDRFYPRHLSCIACQISVNALQRFGSGADRTRAKTAYTRMCELYFPDLEADVPHIRDRIQAEAASLLADDDAQSSTPTKRRRAECSESNVSQQWQGNGPAAYCTPGRLPGSHMRRGTDSTSSGSSPRLNEMLRRPKTRTWELDKLATLCWHMLLEENGADPATGQFN